MQVTEDEAKKIGKKSIIVYTSPHHTLQEKWIDKEYEKIPLLMTVAYKRIIMLSRKRNERRDEETNLADVICVNSNLVAQSLLDAGFSKDKMIVIPLGAPPAIQDDLLPKKLLTPLRFIYAGPVSVRKGAHYLLKAWKLLGKTQAELHFYGRPLLPKSFLVDCGRNIIFHNSVSQKELFDAYQKAVALIFPTLCDGFGMVVTEAMSRGLPVITTPNCGVSESIKHGNNGFFVSPGNSEVLADRIKWCIQNSHQLLNMRQNALDTARRWTWVDFRAALREQLSEKLNLNLKQI